MAHAREWPDIHSVREILAGEPIRGLWFDRTQECAARNRGEDFSRLRYASEEAFELTPLPCWAYLPPDAYRQQVAALMEQIESEAAAELAKSGRVPLGVAGVLRSRRRLVQSEARSLLLLCTMRQRRPCAKLSGKRTVCS